MALAGSVCDRCSHVVKFLRGKVASWSALWFYPFFWLVHLIGDLPPRTDHIHQVVLLALSVIRLVLPVRVFFPQRRSRI